MLLPILKKNEPYQEMLAKLDEEAEELASAVNYYRTYGTIGRGEVVAEVLDVIQVCIGILNQAEKEGTDLEKAGFMHLLKLTNRQNFAFEGYMSLRRVES